MKIQNPSSIEINSPDLRHSYQPCASRDLTSNNKDIAITYSGTKITKVTDGAGRETVFAYNSNNYLTSITDPAGRSTSYTYSGGYLTGITKPDNTSINYTYETDGTKKILTRITDTDGSAVGFKYFEFAPRRVSKVSEYGTSGGSGNELTYTYNAGETMITDRNGRSETMLFDGESHTVCVKDGEGNAVYGSYNNTSDNKRHALKYQSDMQKTVRNYLINHSFESSGISPWENYLNATQGEGTALLTTEQRYMGSKSMKISSTNNEGRFGYMQPLTLEGVAGSTYTFSAYVKITSNQPSTSGNSGLMMGFSYQDTENSWHIKRRAAIKTTSTNWQRVSYTYTFPANVKNNYFRVVLGFENSIGTAYFDCCQLEEGGVANSYNIIENGHFMDSTGQHTAQCWIGANLNSTEDKTVTGRSGRGYKIIGEDNYKNIQQSIKVTEGHEGDKFVFGAWAKANAVPLLNKNGGNVRDFDVRITFDNTDGTVNRYYFYYEAKTSNWQFMSGSVSAPHDYTHVRIAVLYNYQRNYAVFDDIQLFREAFGTKYTYYGSGRVSSETDSSGNKITYAYWNTTSDDLRLVSYYNPDGQPVGTEEYRYNNDMQVIWYKDINGLITTYNYDENGNSTDAEQTADGTKITSGETESGNYVSSSTDNLGHTVTYDYNPNTGVLNSATDANGTETNYTYNPNNDRLLTVTTGGSTNTYTYSGNHVSSITHNTDASDSVTYNFVYDQFGNVTNVKVGNVSLMSYQYGANNGNLTRSTYGNGDYVENVYDNLDRVEAVKYNGVEKFRWAYGANGSVGLHTDLVNGVKWQYDYNLNGDVTSVVGNNGTSFRYNYRSDGMLTGDTVTVGGVSKTTAYTKNLQGVLAQIEYGNGSNLSYTYDGFSRVTRTVLGNSQTTSALATSYSYLPAATAGETTDVVSSLTNTFHKNNSNENENKILNYTYDANGNILTVSDETSTLVSYEYDALNQLVREENQWLNKIFTYNYDNGGNIKTVKEYDYTTNSLNAQNTYSYTDSNWKDKLTSYNGHTIAYDAIGNPTTYYNGTTFTWQNGRELAGLTTGEGTGVTYTYNSDGIRTQKTVGTVTTDYTLEGDKVVYETNGTDAFWYYYDENGAPVSFEYNGTTYYYVKNLQGDIIAILNASGEQVVEYKYDAWGNVSIDEAPLETIGIKNPYRYRGYRYDAETGLYYLQSRYYDPKIGRFINADEQTNQSSTLGLNLFAYCYNNFVNKKDLDGREPITLTVCGAIFVITLVATIYTVAVVSSPTFQRGWNEICGAIGRKVSRDLSNLGIAANLTLIKWKHIYKSIAQSFAKSTTIPSYNGKSEVHHIVAKKATNATLARKILNDVGIGYQSPANLISIKKGLHRRLHTNAYYGWANSVVISAYYAAGCNRFKQRQNVLLALSALRKCIEAMNKISPY